MIVSHQSPRTIETKVLSTCFPLNSTMEKHNLSNQTMVYQVIPDTVFVDLNRVADEIEVAKKVAVQTANKVADKIQADKIYKKFTDIAEGLMITKEIIYKGYQKFNLEYVEIADSRNLNKKRNKGVSKSKTTQQKGKRLK